MAVIQIDPNDPGIGVPDDGTVYPPEPAPVPDPEGG